MERGQRKGKGVFLREAEMLKISEDTLRQVTDCTNGFSCLSGESGGLCEIEQDVGGKVLFVRCMNRDCSYRMSFGYGYICTCPVRREIYHRYGL
jgi:hypothetical protein